jgi:pimeloyl-ACP methyl ester carboxylesterase
MSNPPHPTLLIPGLLCTPELYGPQIPALWRFGPVMVADHRHDESIEGIASRILADAPPRFSLAGLSMGGYLAMAILGQAPERVLRLALLDTSARADTPEASERRRGLIAMTRAGRFDEVPDTHFPSFVHERRRNDAALRNRVRRMANETGAEAYIRQQIAITDRPDRRALLTAIGCPTLVLVGDADLLTPPALSQEIVAAVPRARIAVIPDCGHLSTLEQPEAVTAELVRWLSE